MTLLEKFFLVIIIIFIICAVVLFLVFKYRRRYTRERFAFVATLMIGTLFTTGVLPMLQSESILTLSIKIINHYCKLNIPVEGQAIWTQTLVILAFLGICWLVRNVHKDWDGAVSVRQKENERLSQESGWLKDSAAHIFIKDRTKLEIYMPAEEDEVDSVLKKTDEEELAWHVQAADLLSLISQQYKIDIDKDWYSEYLTFISKYGKNDELLGIYCTLNEPTEDALRKFIDFVKTHNQGFHKLVVAVKNGKDEKTEAIIEDFRVEFRYEKEMLDNLVDFSNYFEAIKTQYLEEEITGMWDCNP